MSKRSSRRARPQAQAQAQAQVHARTDAPVLINTAQPAENPNTFDKLFEAFRDEVEMAHALAERQAAYTNTFPDKHLDLRKAQKMLDDNPPLRNYLMRALERAQAAEAAVAGSGMRTWAASVSTLNGPPSQAGKPGVAGTGQRKPRPDGVYNANQLRAWADANPWIRAAVSYRKNQISVADLVVEPLDKNQSYDKNVLSTVQQILDAPNEYMESMRTILARLEEDLQVLDRGVIEKGMTPARQPYALYSSDAAKMKIYPGWSGNPNEPRYLYEDSALNYRVGLRNDEVIMMHMNEATYRFGLSNVAVLRREIEADIAATEGAMAAVKGNPPSSIVQLPKEGDAGIRKIRNTYDLEVAGQRQILFMGGEEPVHVYPLMFSAKDNQWMEWQEWIAKKIATIFGIAAQRFNITSGTNRATAQVAQTYDEDAGLVPMLLVVEEFLNREFLFDFAPKTPDGRPNIRTLNLAIRFPSVSDAARLMHYERTVALASKANPGAPILTPNDILGMLGRPPVPNGGDTFWMVANGASAPFLSYDKSFDPMASHENNMAQQDAHTRSAAAGADMAEVGAKTAKDNYANKDTAAAPAANSNGAAASDAGNQPPAQGGGGKTGMPSNQQTNKPAAKSLWNLTTDTRIPGTLWTASSQKPWDGHDKHNDEEAPPPVVSAEQRAVGELLRQADNAYTLHASLQQLGMSFSAFQKHPVYQEMAYLPWVQNYPALCAFYGLELNSARRGGGGGVWAFDEDQHPRDSHGRFAPGGGESEETGSGKGGKGSEGGEGGKGGEGDAKLSSPAANELIDKIHEDGGFSYQVVDKTSPTDGYMVSRWPERSLVRSMDDLHPGTLQRYVSANKDVLGDKDKYLGGWFDKESGKVYIDISQRVGSQSEAEALCRAHGQRAYYGIKEQDEFRVLSESEAHKGYGYSYGRRDTEADYIPVWKRRLQSQLQGGTHQPGRGHGGVHRPVGEADGQDLHGQSEDGLSRRYDSGRRRETGQPAAELTNGESPGKATGGWRDSSAPANANPPKAYIAGGGAWDEDLHPRDDHGRFAPGGGEAEETGDGGGRGSRGIAATASQAEGASAPPEVQDRLAGMSAVDVTRLANQEHPSTDFSLGGMSDRDARDTYREYEKFEQAFPDAAHNVGYMGMAKSLDAPDGGEEFFQQNPSVIAVTHGNPDGTCFVFFNNTFYADADAMDTMYAQHAEKGWFVPTDLSAASYFSEHELGHAVEFWTGSHAMDGKALIPDMPPAMGDNTAGAVHGTFNLFEATQYRNYGTNDKALSTYGSSDKYENWAEGYVAANSGSTAYAASHPSVGYEANMLSMLQHVYDANPKATYDQAQAEIGPMKQALGLS